MKISHWAVKHPVIIGMCLIVLIVFGIISVTSMNMEFMADISMPSVIVFGTWPGANAEDVEQDLTAPLEDIFITLPDFKSVTSSSSNSLSVVTVTFRDGVDPYDMLPEMRHRITQAMPDLPAGLSGTPTALVGGAEMLPVFTFAVDGGSDMARTTEYIEETLIPRITSISGVASVEVSGGKKLRANVKLNLDDLAAKSISASTVYKLLEYANTSLPAGTVTYKGNTVDVRFDGGFTSIEDIKSLPVGQGDNSSIITIEYIADVTLDYPEEGYYVTDGKNPIIVVEITKRSDGNTVKIIKDIKQLLNYSEQETGNSIKYNIISDDSRTVLNSLSTVAQSGLTGIIMAVIIIFLFLNDWRSTLIIGLSIPISLLFTFIAMKLTGINFNLMSLSGLVISLGMVVDGSIVMIEQVFRHYKKKNDDGTLAHPLEDSIFSGTDEVGSSILASTATTVAVFIPLASLSGIVGMILRDVSLTIIMALVSSFVVSIIVIPFLMNLILSKNGPKEKKPTLFIKAINKIENWYKKALNWALSSWKFIILVSVAILAVSILLVSVLGIAFIPSTDNSDFYISMEFPSGYSLDQTHEKMMKVGEILKERVSEVSGAVFFSGKDESAFSSSNTSYMGYAHVVLKPVAERKRRVFEIIRDMQDVLTAEIPDSKVSVTNGGFDKLVGFVSGGGGYGLTLISEDMDLLYDTASTITEYLKQDPEVVTVSMDTSKDSNSLVVKMSQELMNSVGVNSYEAGIISNIVFMGMDAGRFRNATDNNRYDIRLFSDKTNKPVTVADIENIQVTSSTGTPISFGNIATVNLEQGISQINHTDRSKTITISANLISEDTSGVSSRMTSYLQKNPLPQGIESTAGGMSELLADSIPPMVQGLLIAWFLVYTVMVIQFERFRQPFLVMVTIPFCLIGVIVGLLIFGSTMSMLALMGVISLGGIIVNNGIILIDYVNLLRKRREVELKENGKIQKEFNYHGRNQEEELSVLRDDVVRGSASRLRPIFMTTLTTMLGVIPMAMSKGEGAEIYAPLGQAIAGGLFTSTLITLFIIPILYFLTEGKQIKKATKEILSNDEK